MSKEVILHEGNNNGFMSVSTLDQAIKVSEIIASSGICPTAYKGKAGDVLVAMQMGAELGLKPMQALQNIAVINGRPSVWGDAMLAVCRQSPEFEYIKEVYTADDNSYTCIVKRKKEPEFIAKFSEGDAKKANLWNKAGVWQNYPKRMLQMRARGFALRDAFPDLLRGIITQEEARDYPSTVDQVKDYSQAVGNIIDINPTSDEPEKITPEQVKLLEDKIANTNSDLAKLCEMLKIEKLSDMIPEQFPLIDAVLEKRKGKVRIPKELATDPETGEVLPEGLQ